MASNGLLTITATSDGLMQAVEQFSQPNWRVIGYRAVASFGGTKIKGFVCLTAAGIQELLIENQRPVQAKVVAFKKGRA